MPYCTECQSTGIAQYGDPKPALPIKEQGIRINPSLKTEFKAVCSTIRSLLAIFLLVSQGSK
jgi:hypothetical protein